MGEQLEKGVLGGGILMPRITRHYWLCGLCKTNNIPSDRKCSNCGTFYAERCAQPHSSERAVVYYHPETGQHVTPARADQPIPEVYSRQGFERREIMSMTQWERESGSVHEATNFNPGNEPMSSEAPPPKTDKETVARELGAALSADPVWTGHEKLMDSV
jgi:hypothetical protein